MERLDGIFGAERAGGWEGTSWRPEHARTRKNIRTWGQLGLTGRWADKGHLRLRPEPATTGGWATDGLLGGSDKWNEGAHLPQLRDRGRQNRPRHERGPGRRPLRHRHPRRADARDLGGRANAQKLLPLAWTNAGPWSNTRSTPYGTGAIRCSTTHLCCSPDPDPSKPIDWERRSSSTNASS